MAQNDYQNSFDKMQRDAINRVREMQRRAQISNPPQDASPPLPPPEPKAEPQRKEGSLTALLKDINIDEEKALIGLLIYILYKNGADTKLLLALGYLIL